MRLTQPSRKLGVFLPGWKWRGRSTATIPERTREETRKHYTGEEKVAILRLGDWFGCPVEQWRTSGGIAQLARCVTSVHKRYVFCPPGAQRVCGRPMFAAHLRRR